MGSPASHPVFQHRHILGIADLRPHDIAMILDTAESMREVSKRRIKKVPTLRGMTVVNYFAEPSTRTRLSFELAEKRLSADSVNIQVAGSSASKGETLLDTIRNITAMKPDVIVIRHGASGAPHMLARHVDASIINAGDGIHEHPTQALLDAFTMRSVKGKLEGLSVLICGDIAHSRVARSNALLLGKMGAKVTLFGPRTMIPPFAQEVYGAGVAAGRLRDIVGEADVIMMLRVQKERSGEEPLYPSDREYARFYGLNSAILARARGDVLVMHPGPVNRGVEISPEVADSTRSLILEQVENGVAVRMAILYLLCGAPSMEI
jgi:aspartate carbamoyltransferase catalytic subunit